MNIRQITVAGITALAVVGLASCGSSSTSSSPTIPADVGLTVLAGPGIKFDKSTYTVAAGDLKIAYQNRDAQRHTLDVVSSTKTVIGRELAVGKSGAIDVGTYQLPAGTYTLECTVPGHDAMRAKLVVTG